jgi:hypothetical protein
MWCGCVTEKRLAQNSPCNGGGVPYLCVSRLATIPTTVRLYPLDIKCTHVTEILVPRRVQQAAWVQSMRSDWRVVPHSKNYPKRLTSSITTFACYESMSGYICLLPPASCCLLLAASLFAALLDAGVAVGGKEVKAVNELPYNGGGVPFLT